MKSSATNEKSLARIILHSPPWMKTTTGAFFRLDTFEPMPMEVWGNLQIYDGGAWVIPEGPKLHRDPVSGSEVWL
jgi:hypothetical protein